MIKKIILFIIIILIVITGIYYFRYFKQNKYISQFDCELINQRKCTYFIMLDCIPIPDKSVCEGTRENFWSPNY